MNEKYMLINKENVIDIVYGKNKDLIYEKHKKAYGEASANNILDNMKAKFENSIEQINNPKKNNNILLVGKVQSGKTSSLEMFTALAFDNGYKMVVIYGGYDSTLLVQTQRRFSKSFEASNEPDNENVIVFSTENIEDLESLNGEIITKIMEAKKNIILLTLKRPNPMKKVNNFLKKINELDIKTFIIDDEGDQASLNTMKDKVNDASATYREIKNMKKLLKDPLYLSVTATPQANIFLDEYSVVRPDNIMLIEPAFGYCGANVYHQSDKFIEIVEDDISSIEKTSPIPLSLKNAINYFIIASAIKLALNINSKSKYSDMIIHSHRTISEHNILYTVINSYINDLKDCVNYNEFYFEDRLKIFEKCYNKYFSEEYNKTFKFENLKTNIEKVINNLGIILKNSQTQNSETRENFITNKIYVGGDLLQRGVTFENLITTYFTRWAKSGGNMDTNLQRARWFGYRSNYINLCKIFLTKEISVEFYGLAETEDDLWEQFHQIENKEKNISEVVITSPEYSNQKPCRGNVAKFKKLKFNKRWLKQKYCLADLHQIQKNNRLIQELKNAFDIKTTNLGRVDGKPSAKYIEASPQCIISLIENTDGIFENNPFIGINITKVISNCNYNIPVIFISKENDEPRIRSLYPNGMEIKVLQQGADNVDPDKVVYEGDAKVVIDKNKLNIQIHKIKPKDSDKTYSDEYIQYMFAIYSPSETSYFTRG